VASSGETRIFNRRDQIVEGWYFALPSKDLRRGQAKPLRLIGEELVIYRGEDGETRAMQAYCPHMGAHLAEGRVQGNSIRCMFHYWKFAADGRLEDIPCSSSPLPRKAALKTWPVAEKYGMIWIWTGPEARTPVPYVPELKDVETEAMLGNRFTKACHPNVVMINAIDAQHFFSVHPMARRLAGKLRLEPYDRDTHNIEFRNSTPVPRNSLLNKVIAKLYRGPLTYWMSYWFGTTGSVTLGPDFLHFHIIFALRPTPDGQTEGQTILVTKRRPGPFGYLLSRGFLFATKMVGDYFAKGDTKIFQTINFQLKTPIAEDQAIIRFIAHTEKQTVANWGISARPQVEASRRGAIAAPELTARRREIHPSEDHGDRV